MCGSLIGTPFAIDSENNGFMVHNIYPVAKYTESQSSKSSKILLTSHTELSCLDNPPDFLVLLGLRESDYIVETPVIKLDEILQYLTSQEIEMLYRPLFITQIDESMRNIGARNYITKPFTLISKIDDVNRWKYDVEYVKGIDSDSHCLVLKTIKPEICYNV